jgi:hypothetical protein
MNLKNRSREKTLRDAWYAMSDMLNQKDKVLKIMSYTGNEYRLKVEEIKNCEYSPTVFDNSVPEMQKPAPLPRKIYENSIRTPPRGSAELASILHKKATDLFNLFDSIPELHKRNMLIFLEAIKQQNIPFNFTDPILLDIAAEAMKEEDPQKLMQHIRRYIDCWRSKK